jgi:hypothetical protein
MKQRSFAIYLAVIAVVVAGILPLSARPIDIINHICIDELIQSPRVANWIPVGCEVVDCCPGCPRAPIDWRIRVAGDPIESVTLKFEDLPADMFGKLKLQGSATWIDGSTLHIRKGEIVLSGFNLDPTKAVPVAIPQLNIDKAFADRIKADADQNSADSSADRDANDSRKVSLIVEQMVGQVVVNESRLIYFVSSCSSPALREIDDRISLIGNASSDNAVIMFDARRAGGCVKDEIQRTTGAVSVGSVLSNSGCNSNAAVFSDDNAMAFFTPVSVWSDPLGDLLTLDLMPMWQVPTTVWVMRGPFAATRARVLADFARANELYNKMNCGISFSAPVINDATADSDTPGLLNATCPDGNLLRTRIGFTNGRLNIYYLNLSVGRGWWCEDNTILIGSGADNESLTHEFGHAFSLWHSNGIAGIGGNNVMSGGGGGRNYFTIGQCFRCNVEYNSTLNSNAIRTGTKKDCPDENASPSCPKLRFDVTPR